MARKVDREVLIGFIDEAKSYLPAIADGIDAFKADATQMDGLEVAHRHVHTIKGASSMVGLTGLSHIAYQFEESLEEIGAGNIELDETAVSFLTQSVNSISTYLAGVMTGNVDEKELVTAITLSYRRLRGMAVEEDETAVANILVKLEDTPKVEAKATVVETGVSQTAVSPTPDLIPEPEIEDISPELLEAFSIEAEDHMHNIGTQLAALGKDPSQLHLLEEIRRAVHTIKGGAGTVGINAIARMAHRMEDALDLLHEGTIGISDEIMAVLFATADALEDLLHGVDDQDELRTRLAELYRQYDEWLGAQTTPSYTPPTPLQSLGEEPTIDLAKIASSLAEAEAKSKTDAISSQQPVQAGEVVRVPLERLDELVRSVSELVITRTTFEQHMGGLVRLVDELWHSFERLRQVSHKLETDYEVTALSGGNLLANGGSRNGESDEFDDLQMDRYTEFHLLSRELTETTSDLRTIGNELRHLIGDFDGVLNRQGRLSSEIQDKLMRTRMVPLATIATRLHRAVRVVSQKQGKLVDLVMIGEQIELDKKVLEEMADPLLHVLRNAVDHGIEPAALRMVMGKPERGQITLKAYYQGNQVVLEIQDDGAGLEPQLLRAKAIANGYVSEAEAHQLSNDELHSLIFTAGFSTAEQITDVSGRGVGLDVLRNSVNKLKGSLTVTSTSGQGTTFTIRLPMTLAVTRALLIKTNQETFAIPLAAVSQILRVDRSEFEKIGDDDVLRVAGKVYPLLDLSETLGLPQVGDEMLSRPPILILDAGAQQVALIVDEIMEGREIVVKTLGNHLRHVHAVTGATLMGDGSIVLILNPAELVNEPTKTERREWTPVTGGNVRKPLSVLIVDDSVSVRRVLSNLIKNTGWQPTTAKDGLEALGYIQNTPSLPDVILLDIEMPRMDGYELATTLQGHDLYRTIPIVMLTSRAGDKHRQKAMDIGVADYLVKPYQDETLVNIVRKLGQKTEPQVASSM